MGKNYTIKRDKTKIGVYSFIVFWK